MTMVEQDRDIAIRAAEAFDRATKEREKMLEMIEQQNLSLEVKNNHILTLEATLAEERNRIISMQGERDEQLRENAYLAAGLAGIKADLTNILAKLEHLELPMPEKRKRNGRRRIGVVCDPALSETLPDPGAGPEPVAEDPSILAQLGPQMLGQHQKGTEQ